MASTTGGVDGAVAPRPQRIRVPKKKRKKRQLSLKKSKLKKNKNKTNTGHPSAADIAPSPADNGFGVGGCHRHRRCHRRCRRRRCPRGRRLTAQRHAPRHASHATPTPRNSQA